MFSKLLALGISALLSLGLLELTPPLERGGEPPLPKKKGERPRPEDDLRKAYNLLRRLRVENRSAGRPETRVRDWTERAAQFYRDGIKAYERGELHEAHENGAVAHDLARAADHAQNARLFDRPDDDLPPPPANETIDTLPEPIERDLRKAHERLSGEDGGAESRLYRDAARDLYTAARRDAQAGRYDRAGELARAADAMTHVIEHLGHLADRPSRPDAPDPEPKARLKGRRGGEPPAPERERFEGPLPPPL